MDPTTGTVIATGAIVYTYRGSGGTYRRQLVRLADRTVWVESRTWGGLVRVRQIIDHPAITMWNITWDSVQPTENKEVTP